VDRLLHRGGALLQIPAEHRELAGHIAAGDGQVDPAAAHLIKDRDVLRQPERIVQRRDHRLEIESKVACAPGHGGGQHDRRRQIAILDPVMLRQHSGMEAVPVAILRHLDRGRVELGVGGRPEGGRAHIEAKGDLGHRNRP